MTRFGTGHLLFTRIDDSYDKALDAATETLSVRYAMDFRRAAQRYCALGRPEQVAERIREFHAAGVRHVVLDLLGPYEQRHDQIARFAAEAMPLLRDLTAPDNKGNVMPAMKRDLTAMLRPTLDRAGGRHRSFALVAEHVRQSDQPQIPRRRLPGQPPRRHRARPQRRDILRRGRRADRSRAADGADGGDRRGAGRPCGGRCAQCGDPDLGLCRDRP